jgi:predicted dehydrogenase
MAASIRWGILGTGVVARRFCTSLKLVDNARIAAVASIPAAEAHAFAAQFGADRAHETAESLVCDPDVDVVYVATPTALHVNHSRLGLEAGKAVLCEKPLGCSAADARTLVDTARARGQFLMEGMWMRFLPIMSEVRRRVRAGYLGQLRMLQADLAFPASFNLADPRFKPAGGGALLDLGVYPVSLAVDLLGRPEAVEGQVICSPNGVDQQAIITLSYAGVQAVLTCGFHGRGRNDAVLIGERGRIQICEPLYASQTLTSTTWPSPSLPGPEHGRSRRAFERILREAKLYERFVRGLRRLAGRERFVRRPFRGFGYQFEATEVGECLARGELESAIMPLDESIAVLEVLDVARIRETG